MTMAELAMEGQRVATLFLSAKRYTDAITYIGGCGMDISLGIVVILIFVVDFLLIVGTNSISGYPLQIKRASLASLSGAAYALLCLLPDFAFLGKDICRIFVLLLISMIAFGWKRNAFQRAVILLLLSLKTNPLSSR